MEKITRFLSVAFYAAAMSFGYLIYLASKRTPNFAYQSMIKLFCLTDGRSNDWISKIIGAVETRYRFAVTNGILGNTADLSVIEPVIKSLRERGYYLFDDRLPDDMCDRLLAFATSTAAEAYQMDGQQHTKSVATTYPRNSPQAVRYEFRAEDLLANPDIQKLLADLSFASVAQEYLGAKPVIDVLSMWWLTAFSDKPDSIAAQYFHFDMDRPKWLKFFIYLTDVTPTNGPHTFVSGSHRSGKIPQHLLRKGYARLSDAEVGRVFDQQDLLEFSGRRGSILAEDTRGLHKGRHVEQGDRLMLQIQFSNSLFGANYPKATVSGPLSSDLRACASKWPQLYSTYL
jgi:hypothetical protein